MRRVVIGAGLLAMAGALVSPVGAAEYEVSCGAVVTHDVVLETDLVGCAGDGLVVGADGVTIDLAGHAILGESRPGTAGIRNHGHDGVRIEGRGLEGSRIEGFDVAVVLARRADDNRVRGLNVRSITHGIAVFNSDRNHIDDNSAAFAGIDMNGPCHPGDPAAIALFDSHANQVTGNTAQLSLYGISLVRSDHNIIEANEAAPMWSDGNECDGIALDRSDRNRVVANTVANNHPDGILVSRDSDRNVVAGNVAFQNADDGLDIGNRRTTLTGNLATSNVDIGIDAVRGVTDGGGNEATENFGPVQCRNVSCSPPSGG